MVGLPLNSLGLLIGAPVGAPGPSSSEDYAGVNWCRGSKVSPTVRGEGLAEMLGDIVLTCSNVEPTGQGADSSEVVMDIFVTLNVNVTTNLAFGQGSNVTDAVLVINENNCSSPAVTGGVFGACGSMPAYQDPQFSVLEAPNRIAWRGVHVPIAGPGSPMGPDGLVTSIRITSLRGNAATFFGFPFRASRPCLRSRTIGSPSTTAAPRTKPTASAKPGMSRGRGDGDQTGLSGRPAP